MLLNFFEEFHKPIAQRHDGEQDEDTSDAHHEHDDHDYGVAVGLFYWWGGKKNMKQRVRACRTQSKQERRSG